MACCEWHRIPQTGAEIERVVYLMNGWSAGKREVWLAFGFCHCGDTFLGISGAEASRVLGAERIMLPCPPVSRFFTGFTFPLLFAGHSQHDMSSLLLSNNNLKTLFFNCAMPLLYKSHTNRFQFLKNVSLNQLFSSDFPVEIYTVYMEACF